MNTFRFTLIRLWLRGLRALSTDVADPADVYFCYRLLLEREPDADGWKHHLKSITPRRTREMLVESSLGSTEYQEAHGRTTLVPVETERFVIWVDAKDPLVARGIMTARSYETHVTAALLRELHPDSTFVDIGANMGWFTLLGATVARQVIAIEPNPANVQLLYRSVLANGFENVRVLQGAVTDGPNLLQLNFLHSNGSVSSVEASAATATIVQGNALDSLLKDIERIDVMKMDIEGHEPIALEGMRETLRRFRPVLIFEFHPAAIRQNAGGDPEGFLRTLGDLGYRLAVIRLDGTESDDLSAAGIMGEWQRINAEMEMDGDMHLDLIGRTT
ncbi:MAG TPA: FkbM family methyltransferase [Promineifilum sp.]|mgnify:CR=1 FL=1|nr:FkbM family methyltransferase [Promineifilum sp.]